MELKTYRSDLPIRDGVPPISGTQKFANAMLANSVDALITLAHRKRAEDAAKKRIGPHASDALAAGGRPFCLRKCVLAHFYWPNVVYHDPFLANILANGWSVHERLQALFAASGSVVEMEVEHVAKGSGVRYTPDLLLDLPEQGLLLVEIKGYNSDECAELERALYPPEDAWKQAQMYVCLLELEIERFIIIVENKNNQRRYVWGGRRDPEAIPDILGRLERIRVATLAALESEARQLPPRLCTSADCELARNCPQRVTCFRKYEDRASALLPAHERCKGVS